LPDKRTGVERCEDETGYASQCPGMVGMEGGGWVVELDPPPPCPARTAAAAPPPAIAKPIKRFLCRWERGLVVGVSVTATETGADGGVSGTRVAVRLC